MKEWKATSLSLPFSLEEGELGQGILHCFNYTDLCSWAILQGATLAECPEQSSEASPSPLAMEREQLRENPPPFFLLFFFSSPFLVWCLGGATDPGDELQTSVRGYMFLLQQPHLLSCYPVVFLITNLCVRDFGAAPNHQFYYQNSKQPSAVLLLLIYTAAPVFIFSSCHRTPLASDLLS